MTKRGIFKFFVWVAAFQGGAQSGGKMGIELFLKSSVERERERLCQYFELNFLFEMFKKLEKQEGESK